MNAVRTVRYDTDSIRTLFDDMAATYGRVNLISSFGFTARWRRQVVAGLPLGSAQCIVDLMSGMGELLSSLAPDLRPETKVIGVDLSPEMTRRTRRNWNFPVEIVVTDVFVWDHLPAFADVVVSSFGLKTFDRDQLHRLAGIVTRALKPGGSFSFVEISLPPSLPLRLAFMVYLRWLIPVIGWMFLGNPDCYRMLWLYARAFRDATYFADCLRKKGLEVEDSSYFWGCATGVRGTKPQHLGPSHDQPQLAVSDPLYIPPDSV